MRSLPLAAVLQLLFLFAYAVPLLRRGDNTSDLYPPIPYDPSYQDYVPDLKGVPIAYLNESSIPTNGAIHRTNAYKNKTISAIVEASCSGPTASNPSTFWYESITHNGISPFIDNGADWKVFRNVKTDYDATGDGSTDDRNAIQNAIDDGNSYTDRTANKLGTTGQPAAIYLPAGTYIVNDPIQLYVGTVLIGDPLNPPVLKAGSSFSGDTLVYGKDPNQGSTTNFYLTIKNLELNSQNIDGATTFTLLDWSVSQATQLTNVVFNMPNYSTGHTGITMPEGGSGTYMGDLTFYGGVVGINMNNQQYMIKNAQFIGCTTGIYITHCYDCVFQGCSFENGYTAIDMTPGSTYNIGSVIVMDSTGTNLGRFVNTQKSGTGDRSLIIEKVELVNTEVMVTVEGTTYLEGSVSETWIMGNAYVAGGSDTGEYQSSTTYTTARSSALLDSNGKYFTMTPPTYSEYDVDQFINIKEVDSYPVYGDGSTDDTDNINAILSLYANCKIIFFPAGTYIVMDTIIVPTGSRIVGEVWSAISAIGDNFYNPSDPTTMVQVGEVGDVGVAQFSDILFTVADVLQGCTLLEINMAGSSPGDVGFWNTHFRVGGAAGSLVQTNCGGTPDECKAAFALLHLGSTSSAYIEDMWGWTADHDLDGGNSQTISVGRGAYIEATAGTWLVGTAFEHNTLYQYQMTNAQNIYAGMQQCETPYWQGPGQSDVAPAPWTPLTDVWDDPDFNNCAVGDAECGMAWFERIHDSSDLFLYGSGFWTFFNDGSTDNCNGNTATCQTNAVATWGEVTGLNMFGFNTKASLNMLRNFGGALVTQNNNPGGWGGIVAAFLTDL
ncbi:MAG: hypothetical protein M1834_002874 [Cirrosporium novae-zelandiae]|nr:MAG: hypothetical protein M1834_002874 [Cirrosporium novae-zelandiae]